MKKLTLKQCHDIAKERGGECLSTEYVNARTKMRWKCENDHHWNATFDSIKNATSWCRICAGKEKLTLEECHDIAKERGGECLSIEYVNSQEKMRWKCEDSHEWDATFNDIKNQNRWCIICAGLEN